MREPGELTLHLPDDAATRDAGAALARALAAGATAGAFITLAGELGAGKTTFARGLLQAAGVAGPVRSPTYTLVETYRAGDRTIHHLDWYRLAGDEDLEALGFRDLPAGAAWVLVEWPERAPATAAEADLEIRLDYATGGGRRLTLRPRTATGARVVHLMPDRALG